MRYFYAFMCVMSELDYVIANSTGRNPDHVRQLREQWNYWLRQRELYELTRT